MQSRPYLGLSDLIRQTCRANPFSRKRRILYGSFGDSSQGKRAVPALNADLLPSALVYAILLGTCVVISPIAVSASETSPISEEEVVDSPTQTADELVQEALASEIYGEAETRERLLRGALQLDPDHELARWHLGYLRVRNEWVLKSDIEESVAENRSLKAYEIRREQTADTVEAQLELARWCQRRSLADQQKAHLFRVLQLDPSHTTARNLLGFRMVNGEWVSNTEIQQSAEQQQKVTQALREWRSTIGDISRSLQRTSPDVRETAFKKLRSIQDADAIPAIEAILSTQSEEISLEVVETLEAMTSKDSSLSLARHAVLAPWESVRKRAAESLVERDQIEFVPQMLASLQGPVMTMQQLLPGRGERLVHRQVYVREGQDQINVQVEDANYRRRVRIGDAEATWENAIRNLGNEAQNRNARIDLENQSTEQLNNRIIEALRISTEQPDMPADPKTWWAWWNQDNDILLQGVKPVQTAYTQRDVVLQEQAGSFFPSPQSGNGRQGSQRSQVQPRQRHECLVRGTLIQTAKGPMAVETIQIGDMVLSKDIESGELGFRPVLRTTVRPAGKTIQLEAGDEVIRSSNGHPFWVSGEGWVLAKDLQSGMELHTLNGTVRISRVSEAAEEETYNLVVDDFATYFVGDSSILSHDHTMPSATDRIVPGLEE